ncbi:MAG TPA: DUF4878 domain-containing protein [Niabella sp.]|nr:DUF4878 domain-containing protein [Niabella sp.]HQW14085.1 DUF4878 domain-containing protein [Niabella sp.]HQX19372.1 DUF4878 domain-containing protein [Niabella sp.]HQX40275.1 DUF4878 domain-containing protein [Niabella sp.]HRB05589.1 DUF4878 domain-containing protein [Niabella sp.]
MKRYIHSFFVLAIFSIVWVGCSSSATSNDPNEVLQTFFNHLAKKDIDGASKFVTSDSKPTMQMLKKGMDMAEKLKDSLPQNDLMKDFGDVVYEDARLVSDSAFILVKSKSGARPDVEFKLIKESNGWKVDFTMSALMGMGVKAGAEKGSEVVDSLNNTINSEEVQKGLKMADSVLKSIDSKTLEKIQEQINKLK